MTQPRQPSGYISVEGLRVFAYHGVEPQETQVGNTFEVSVTVAFPCEHAMRTDRLDLTINYAEIVDIIKAEMNFPSKLLEHVAFRIYEAITRRFIQVTCGTISIYKLQPPIEAELSRVGFCFRW